MGDATGIPRATSRSLERGLAILSSFSTEAPALGITELARGAGLTKSTTFRYVATLTALGYLRQDAVSRRYSLGPRVVDLGFAAIGSIELTSVAGEHLQALSDEIGCTVSMAVLDDLDIVYVDRHRPGRAVGLGTDLDLRVGSRLPAYCTSMGKVLLAAKAPAVRRGLLERSSFAPRAPKTITEPAELASVLATVARTGIAVNDEELAPGLRSMAAPVRDRTGTVVAAVNIAVQLTTWSVTIEALVARLERPLRRATAEVSSRLGYRPA